MTDAHCHIPLLDEDVHFVCTDGAVREGDVRFAGTHPWQADFFDAAILEAQLESDKHCGVGEIGLDRLKERQIGNKMREVFRTQLELAAAFSRPVVLHGAKCWGEVVKECQSFKGKIPAFLFHGFSRSWGLLDAIRDLNGFISVGSAILNDHAENYRAGVKNVPQEIILVESDRTCENAAKIPPVREIAKKLALSRHSSQESIFQAMESNAKNFIFSLK